VHWVDDGIETPLGSFRTARSNAGADLVGPFDAIVRLW
jgi:hypothetical protein